MIFYMIFGSCLSGFNPSVLTRDPYNYEGDKEKVEKCINNASFWDMMLLGGYDTIKILCEDKVKKGYYD